MLRIKRLPYDPEWWGKTLETFSDRTIFQSPAWLAFLKETQNGDVIIAAVRDGNSLLGYFSGLIVRRFGVPLLGSPLPGWTTSYMGFNLHSDIPRSQLIDPLRKFAFQELGCVHLELMDRRLSTEEVEGHYSRRDYCGFEIDLTRSEEELLSRIKKASRRCMKTAERLGVQVEEAWDEGFAEDYYAQIQDVFARQRLVPTYSIERVRSLMRHLLSTGNLLLLRGRDPEGHTVSTGIVIAMNGVAYWWGGASWHKYQHLRPNEPLFWHSMLYWKARGIKTLDLGGAGEYKRKYGVSDISVPWLRVSKYPVLPALRDGMAALVKVRQRIAGKFSPQASHAA